MASAWLKTPLGFRSAAAGAGTVALIAGVLFAVFSTSSSDAAIEQHRALLIAREAKGDYSDARLQAMVDAMSPASAVLASRYDPALFKASAPVVPPSQLDRDMLQLLPGLSNQEAAAVNAGVAVSDGPNPAARPFSLKSASAQDRERAVGCMTQAVYYEAGFEPLEGAQAVAQVVINRVRHPAFPKTICGVVFEGSTQKTSCQFSFTCDGSLARPPAAAAWKRAQEVAQRALNGFVMAKVGGATHYHTDWVVPYWAPTLTKVGLVGSQIFYRWPGDWGLPGAFHGKYAGGENPGVDVGGDPLAQPGQPLALPNPPFQPKAEADGRVEAVIPAKVEVAVAEPAPAAAQVSALVTDAAPAMIVDPAHAAGHAAFSSSR